MKNQEVVILINDLKTHMDKKMEILRIDLKDEFNTKLSVTNNRVDSLDQKFDKLDMKINKLDLKIDKVEKNLIREMSRLQRETIESIGHIDEKIDGVQTIVNAHELKLARIA